MKFFRASDYRAAHAWDAIDLAEFSGSTTVRLHWTDAPYIWHVNDGQEVFVVLDGAVEMRYRQSDGEHARRLVPGDICYVEPGDEHVAHPAPEARVLVIERKGSI